MAGIHPSFLQPHVPIPPGLFGFGLFGHPGLMVPPGLMMPPQCSQFPGPGLPGNMDYPPSVLVNFGQQQLFGEQHLDMRTFVIEFPFENKLIYVFCGHQIPNNKYYSVIPLNFFLSLKIAWRPAGTMMHWRYLDMRVAMRVAIQPTSFNRASLSLNRPKQNQNPNLRRDQWSLQIQE